MNKIINIIFVLGYISIQVAFMGAFWDANYYHFFGLFIGGAFSMLCGAYLNAYKRGDFK